MKMVIININIFISAYTLSSAESSNFNSFNVGTEIYAGAPITPELNCSVMCIQFSYYSESWIGTYFNFWLYNSSFMIQISPTYLYTINQQYTHTTPPEACFKPILDNFNETILAVHVIGFSPSFGYSNPIVHIDQFDLFTFKCFTS